MGMTQRLLQVNHCHRTCIVKVLAQLTEWGSDSGQLVHLFSGAGIIAVHA